MPRVRRRGHVMTMLTLEQTMELILGPGSASAFADDRERRYAWRRYRDELMGSVNEFSRPWAFWAFEVGCVPRRAHGERESAVLSDRGLNTDRERAILASDSALASMIRSSHA